MADNDNTNPTSGQTIDLRNPQGAAAQPQSTGAATTQASDDQNLFNKFDIPETVRSQYPDLIPLILETESMNDEERQYWFQILPIMTDEQVGKLREILINEKSQLANLDKEYEQDLKRINSKHVAQWKDFEAKEKRQKLQTAETAAKTGEKATEEELLKKLQGI